MKIYKLSQNVNNSYDTYDSAVVAADNETEAKIINLGGVGCWCEPKDVLVEYIGVAKRGTKKGIIVASFNAG